MYIDSRFQRGDKDTFRFFVTVGTVMDDDDDKEFVGESANRFPRLAVGDRGTIVIKLDAIQDRNAFMDGRISINSAFASLNSCEFPANT